MIHLFKQLRELLNRRERTRVLVLVGMMVVSGGLEVLGIGLIVPVIGLLAHPELAHQNELIIAIKRFLGSAADGDGFVLILSCAIIVLFLGKGAFLIAQEFWRARFLHNLGARLGKELYQTYIHAPYTFHLNRNSGRLVAALTLASSIPPALLMPVMKFLAEAIVVAFILAALLVLSPLVTVWLAVAIAVVGAAIYYPVRQAHSELGRRFNEESLEEGKYALQGLKAIKESKIRNVEAYFASQYATHLRARLHAQAWQVFFSNSGRFVIEAVTVSLGLGALIALILAGLASGSIILTLSLLAVCMVRLMPSLSRIQYALTQIRQHEPKLERFRREFRELPAEDKQPKRAHLPFKQDIALDGVSFRFSDTGPDIVSDFNIIITKNQSIAFVGPTGCGKTTLVDIILGLLKPRQGKVLVDRINIEENLPAWQTRIGYVPQSIFLLDDTVQANVAFGVPENQIDRDQVRECLRTAQILQHVEALPQGIDTMSGDNGVRLSGGQRQRIGIARALYSAPDVLVLDEATSALDTDTEKAFVDALRSLHGKLTILIIAHRLNTVEHCDRIVELPARSRSAQPS